MAPFPDEVDVFSVPHLKMKHLVEDYLEMLDVTDFSNCEAMESLLHSLYSTFCVFKSHERIENEYIMYKLKSRLKDLAVSEHDSLVCNCHSDNRMAEMLQLVQDGYDCSTRSQAERLRYGQGLRSALREFTGTFLPHMKEEEEVFQPMLIKYFEYEELKVLKDVVLEQHERLREVDASGIEPREEEVNVGHQGCEDVADEFEEKFCMEDRLADLKPDVCIKLPEEDSSRIGCLPPELVLKIFSYLWPPDLGRCVQVSTFWNKVAYHPSLWSCIVPGNWARGIWNRPFDKYVPEDDPTVPLVCRMCTMNCKVKRYCQSPMDEDADIDESVGDDYDDGASFSCERRRSVIHKERMILNALVDTVLPRVGVNVRHLSLAGSFNLNGKGLASILFHCQNVDHLDLSYSNVNEESILHLSSFLSKLAKHPVSNLRYLDLSGCAQLTDEGFIQLVACLVCVQSCGSTRRISPKLSFLSLSGCSLITDTGIRCLFTCIPNLNHLDLSGCWNLTGTTLKTCVALCPNLQPENLYYCDHIEDGPHPDTANGCQNLECPVRSCCCMGF